MAKEKILFLTVGTGSEDRLPATVLNPFKKSITTGNFSYYVFLPSQKTQKQAEYIVSECNLKEGMYEIRPLASEGDEDNADKCFSWFNKVIEEKKKDFQIENMVMDITRGTKVMGAALYSAGLRHQVYNYRYITSDKRDKNGMVEENKEVVKNFPAQIGSFLAKVDQAKQFFAGYNFEAVVELFPDNEYGYPEQYIEAGLYIHQCAKFYAAWHRLDYVAAQKCLEKMKNLKQEEKKESIDQLKELGLEQIVVEKNVEAWINGLSNKWPQTDWKQYKKSCLKKALIAKKIALDLYANGIRQCEIGNYEDSKVRIYRVIELLGQIYLFFKGYDTEYIDVQDENVVKFISYLKKKKENVPPEKEGDFKYYQFSREIGARFIKKLDGEGKFLGKYLLDTMKPGKDKESLENFIMSDRDRNVSILIHGFHVIGITEKKEIEKCLEKLETGFKKLYAAINVSNDEYEADFHIAQTMNRFKNLK